MTILADFQLKTCQGMINPFIPQKISKLNRPSFGLSSCGYDLRLGGKFLRQTGFNMDTDMPEYKEEFADEVYYLGPGDFILAQTVETFKMPNNIMGIVHDKSTYARRGLAVQNTIIEPGWAGILTLELTNHSNNLIPLSIGDGICQVIFHLLAGDVDTNYQASGGKYQDATGVEGPK